VTATSDPDLGRTQPLRPDELRRTRPVPAVANGAGAGPLAPAPTGDVADEAPAGDEPALPPDGAAAAEAEGLDGSAPDGDGDGDGDGEAALQTPPQPARRGRAAAAALDALGFASAWLAALVILGGAFFLAWRIAQPQMARPYVYDEAAFSFAGHAVAQTGIPLSNVGHMQTETPGDYSKRYNWALWHPPLYVFILGHAYRLWGETETVARSVGLVCNALAALFAFATALVLLWRDGAGRVRRAAPVFAATGVALYATNPFVIQSALLLDIDGTVLVASISMLTFFYVLLLRSPRPLRSPVTWFLLGLVTFGLALSLWAKMTTAIAVVAAAALVRLLANRPWRPLRVLVDVPVVVIGGVGLFLATWWAACAALGMPFWLPFRILDLELRDAAGSSGSWRENPRVLLDMVSYVALWVSPYLILLFVWAGLARLGDLTVRPVAGLWRRLRRRPVGGEPWGVRPVDFVLLAGGAVAAAYLIKLAASFPKYHITMMPLWAIGIAYLLARYVPRIAVWEPPVYGVVLAGMAGYFVTFVGDRFVLFRGYDFLFPLLVWPAALGFAFLVLGACFGRVYLPRQLAILGLLLTLGWSWGVNTAQVRANYSTAYNYGVAGQRETATYLASILRPDQPFVAPRDVAYYTQLELYVDQDTFWNHLATLSEEGITTFDGSIAGYPRVDVVALFLWDPNLGRIAHDYLAELYEVSYQQGPFLVFVRTSP